jgi:hypothetical protein
MELAPGAPDPSSIPDLTDGLGPEGYELLQTLGAGLEADTVHDLGLSGLLADLGYDPTRSVNTALGALLTQALTGITIDLSGVPVLGDAFAAAGIDNVAALATLLGLNLSDPFNLAGLPVSGINTITVGSASTLLDALGVDLGSVPAFPDSVADEINGTPYVDVAALPIVNSLLAAIPVTVRNLPTITELKVIQTTLNTTGDVNIVDLRIPVVIGTGLGAFAAGMAYPQVLAELPDQPGGASSAGGPLAGSVTILPMVLLGNPGRANGGLFARFYPEAALLGIDTVTPDTEASSSIAPGRRIDSPVGDTGIVVGGANLLPIKLDASVEYALLSDFPSWPNPLALANSAAALLFPTYAVRGVTAASRAAVVDGQLTPQLDAALAASGPLALNLYLTAPVNGALPLLEPLKLPVDLINLVTGANLNNPFATALEPALTSLVNLGYTDVKRTVVNGVPQYDRTFDQADVITPFGTMPSNVDWGQVPGDIVRQLGAGIEQAIRDGLVSATPVVNPLATIAHGLGITGLPGEVKATAAPSTQKSLAAKDTEDAPAAATPAKDRTEGAAKKVPHKRPQKAAAHAAGTVKKTASDHKTVTKSAGK